MAKNPRESAYKRDSNSTNYIHPLDENLNNLHKAMVYDEAGEPHVRVTLGSDTITITGNVNVSTEVSINNTSENPVPVTITDTEIEIKNDINNPIPISANTTVNASGNPIYVEVTSITNTANVNILNIPSVTVNSGNITLATGSNVIGQVNQATASNPWHVDGNVNATITDVITVVVNEDAGEIFGLNNHATNVNRGWTMDNTMRPMISIRLNPATTTSADLMKIVEYEIGNNNANQSTIMYEWYEGDLTIAGAAIPAWSLVHNTAATQYRVYQDQYSSNQGNTFTIPSDTVMRHSGIIIGKNTSGDGIDKPLVGGATGKTWTLCMKRLDNATKLDVWFAFTFKELT